MKLNVLKGKTSKLIEVFIQDSSSTTGAGLTGLVFNSAGLTAYYYRSGAATATAITLATMTLGTWASGGFIVVDGTNMPGVYQIGIPDAALASGASQVIIMLKGATNMAPLVLEIQLVNFDPDDGVRMGLTALPNAAAGAASGLPVNDANLLIDADVRRVGNVVINALIAGRVDANAQAMASSVIGLSQFGSDASPSLHSGTAQAGTASTITLASGASATNSLYNGLCIAIYGGTGAGQARVITAYNGTTKVATVDNNWITNPDATSTYLILKAELAKLDASQQVAVTQAFPTNFSLLSIDANGRVDLSKVLGAAINALTAGRVDSIVGAYAAAQDPGTYVLITPANKLKSDVNGRVSVSYAAIKNVALNNFGFLMVDSTDHVTPKTALVFAAANSQISKDGAAFANTTNLPTEISNGLYKVNLTGPEMNADSIVLKFTGTGADQTTITILTES